MSRAVEEVEVAVVVVVVVLLAKEREGRGCRGVEAMLGKGRGSCDWW